jgi:hypothetical protein
LGKERECRLKIATQPGKNSLSHFLEQGSTWHDEQGTAVCHIEGAVCGSHKCPFRTEDDHRLLKGWEFKAGKSAEEHVNGLRDCGNADTKRADQLSSDGEPDQICERKTSRFP